jgi:hypothetical protein
MDDRTTALCNIESLSDLNCVQFALGDGDNDFEILIVVEFDCLSVHVQENGRCQATKTLVAVRQGMIVTIEYNKAPA